MGWNEKKTAVIVIFALSFFSPSLSSSFFFGSVLARYDRAGFGAIVAEWGKII